MNSEPPPLPDPNWEYTKTFELVLESLARVEDKYDRLPLLAMSADNPLSPSACDSFVSRKLNSLSEWTEYLDTIFSQDFNEAWGPPGVSGKIEEIEQVCAKFERALNSLVVWEETVWCAIPDSTWSPVFDRLKSSTLEIVDSLKTFFHRNQRLISDPNTEGEVSMIFTMRYPKKLKRLDKLIRNAHKANASSSDPFWGSLGVDVAKKFIGL